MAYKKAQASFSAIISITWFIFLIIALLAVVFLVKRYVGYSLDTKLAEAEIFCEGLMFSYGGISYIDPITDRSYPGIIDLNRFDLFTINKSMDYGSKNYYLAANITLENSTGQIKSVLYNEIWYKRWKPLAKRSVPGTGGAKIFNKREYVIIKDRDLTYPGYINFEVVYPN